MVEFRLYRRIFSFTGIIYNGEFEVDGHSVSKLLSQIVQTIDNLQFSVKLILFQNKNITNGKMLIQILIHAYNNSHDEVDNYN